MQWMVLEAWMISSDERLLLAPRMRVARVTVVKERRTEKERLGGSLMLFDCEWQWVDSFSSCSSTIDKRAAPLWIKISA